MFYFCQIISKPKPSTTKRRRRGGGGIEMYEVVLSRGYLNNTDGHCRVCHRCVQGLHSEASEASWPYMDILPGKDMRFLVSDCHVLLLLLHLIQVAERERETFVCVHRCLTKVSVVMW